MRAGVGNDSGPHRPASTGGACGSKEGGFEQALVAAGDPGFRGPAGGHWKFEWNASDPMPDAVKWNRQLVMKETPNRPTIGPCR